MQREIDENKIRENIENNRVLFEYDSKNYEKYVFLKKILEMCDNETGSGIK